MAVLSLTPRRCIVPGFMEMTSARKIFGCQHFICIAPGNCSTRQQQCFRKILPDQIKIMGDNHDCTLLMMPALDQSNQVGNSFLINCIEWLIQQDQLGILDKHPREQCALELPARQTISGRLSKPSNPTAMSASVNVCRSRELCRPNSPRLGHRPIPTRSMTRAGKERSSSDCCGR